MVDESVSNQSARDQGGLGVTAHQSQLEALEKDIHDQVIRVEAMECLINTQIKQLNREKTKLVVLYERHQLATEGQMDLPMEDRDGQ